MNHDIVDESGYVTGIDYVPRYYRELNPHLLRYILIGNGVAAPNVNRPFNYMELGFGRGVSLLVNAAANPHARFYGVDIMTSHVDGVRQACERAGVTNLDVRQIGFAQLAEQDYPKFDFITMHGVWTWISAENRQHILRLIDRNLKPGGVVYLSYNCHPGWAPIVPLRQAMKLAFDRTPGDVTQKVRAAVAYAQSLERGGAKYFTHNPQAAKQINKLSGSDAAYLAHEYLNADWTIFNFSDVAGDFGASGLTFAGSADIVQNISAFVLNPEARKHVERAGDQVEAETLKALFNNQSFRKDIFVREQRRITADEFAAEMDNTMFAPYVGPEGLPNLAVTTNVGKFKAKQPAHAGVLDALTGGPKRMADMRKSPGLAQIPHSEAHNAAYLLTVLGGVTPAAEPANAAAARAACTALNRDLENSIDQSFEAGVFASSVIGGALELRYLEYLFLCTRADQDSTRAFAIMKGRGQTLNRDGKPMTDEEARPDMERRRAEFMQARLPIFRMLGVGA